MRTLEEVVDYLETLRPPFDPVLYLSYRRPEDWRRKKMAENGTPVKMYSATIIIQIKADAYKTGESAWEHFNAHNESAAVAVADAAEQVKAYLEASKPKAAKPMKQIELDLDASDLL